MTHSQKSFLASSAAFGAAVLMFGMGSGVAEEAEARSRCICTTTTHTNSSVLTETLSGWTNRNDPSRWVKVSETTSTSQSCRTVRSGDDASGDSDSGCSGSYVLEGDATGQWGR